MWKKCGLQWLAALVTLGTVAMAAPAAAADFITDDIDLTFPGDETFSGLADDGIFALTFSFVAPMTYADGVRIEISTTAFGGDGSFGDIDFDDAKTVFDGLALTISNDAGPDFNRSTAFIDLPQLKAGTHELIVAGQSVGFGLFSGTILFPAVSVVPEPAAWGMLLIGFAAIGIAVRRTQTGSQGRHVRVQAPVLDVTAKPTKGGAER